MGIPDEESLIKRAKSGHEAAFRQLYDHCFESLYRFLFQFSDSRAEVQDWVQEAFIQAFTQIKSFNQQSSFKTWLFTIGINQMKMARRSGFDFRELPENPIAGQVDRQPLADLITMRNEIDKLVPQKKMVLLLYEVEGYSHAEIADMLNIGESTSRTILSRTKAKLRESIGE